MTTSTAKVLPSGRLSLKDRLSRLTFSEACKLLGPEGPAVDPATCEQLGFQSPRRCFSGGPTCFACASLAIRSTARR